MTSPVSPSETIAKAMEGVTHAPGTWEAEGTAVYCNDKTGQRVADTKGEYLFWTEDEKRANAAYIAACSPDCMREVLDELYALRETALQLEAMQREMAELRTMLERCAPAEQSKSWLPISLWQAARALIQGEKK